MNSAVCDFDIDVSQGLGVFEPYPSQSPSISDIDRYLRSSRLLQALLEGLAGAEAEGVSVPSSAIDQAAYFVCSLPSEWPDPEIIVEPTGKVALDWDLARRRVMSIAFAGDGFASFASLVGYEASHGRKVLRQEIPEHIGQLMSDVRSDE